MAVQNPFSTPFELDKWNFVWRFTVTSRSQKGENPPYGGAAPFRWVVYFYHEGTVRQRVSDYDKGGAAPSNPPCSERISHEGLEAASSVNQSEFIYYVAPWSLIHWLTHSSI